MEKYVNPERLGQFKDLICNLISKKVDINQGIDNANKLISINSEGIMSPCNNPIIPVIVDTDEGSLLQVKNGKIRFMTFEPSVIYVGSSDIADEISGNDGDIFLVL